MLVMNALAVMARAFVICGGPGEPRNGSLASDVAGSEILEQLLNEIIFRNLIPCRYLSENVIQRAFGKYRMQRHRDVMCVLRPSWSAWLIWRGCHAV